MRGVLRLAGTVVLAAMLLLLADRILQPVPIPAGTALLAGLLVFAFRGGVVWVGVGWTVGGLVGAGIHLSAHLAGRSTVPEAGVATHVALDVLGGLAVAAVILVAIAMVARLPWWRRPGNSAEVDGESPTAVHR